MTEEEVKLKKRKEIIDIYTRVRKKKKHEQRVEQVTPSSSKVEFIDSSSDFKEVSMNNLPSHPSMDPTQSDDNNDMAGKIVHQGPTRTQFSPTSETSQRKKA